MAQASVEVEATQADKNVRRIFILNSAIEFAARQSIQAGKDDFRVHHFARYINTSPTDIWNGIGHVGVKFVHGTCASVAELADQTAAASAESFQTKTIEDMVSVWKRSANEIYSGVKCLNNSTVECEMDWQELGPDHHILTLKRCHGTRKGDFNIPVVVETYPKSDTRVELIRTK